MPSRKELRATITTSTHESFMSGVPLAKTSYTDAEANRIHLQALISFHGLMYVDELLSFINASPTNFSTQSIKDKMKSIYKDNEIYRTKFNRDLSISLATNLSTTCSIGRNQAIDKLLTSVLTDLNHA